MSEKLTKAEDAQRGAPRRIGSTPAEKQKSRDLFLKGGEPCRHCKGPRRVGDALVCVYCEEIIQRAKDAIAALIAGLPENAATIMAEIERILRWMNEDLARRRERNAELAKTAEAK